MRQVHREIDAYAGKLADGQFVPQTKFLKALLPAFLIAKHLMLSKLADAFQGNEKQVERGDRIYHRVGKYLSRNLMAERLDMDRLTARFLTAVSPLTLRDDGLGVNVAVDGTALRKDYAHPESEGGMQYACAVHDGRQPRGKGTKRSKHIRTKDSEGKEQPDNLVLGYPALTIDASLPGGNRVTMMEHVYSFDHEFTSELFMLQEQIGKVAPHVGKLAWWSFDRAYSHADYLRAFDGLNLRWIVRLMTGGNHGRVVYGLEHGDEMTVEQIVQSAHLPYVHQTTEGKKKTPLVIRYGLVKAWMQDEKGGFEERARTILVAEINGAPKRFVLLASEWLGDTAEVAEFLRRQYRRRWAVEETHRLNKDHRGFGAAVEDFRVLKFVSIQRIHLLWIMVTGFVSLLRDRHQQIVAKMLRAAHASRRQPVDTRYRLYAQLKKILLDWFPRYVARLRARKRRRVDDTPPSEEALRRVIEEHRREQWRADHEKRRADQRKHLADQRLQEALDKFAAAGFKL